MNLKKNGRRSDHAANEVKAAEGVDPGADAGSVQVRPGEPQGASGGALARSAPRVLGVVRSVSRLSHKC
jgi:hypothetical protein